jgi:hypothetical protein
MPKAKIERVKRMRLAAECAKLDRDAERAEAEQWLSGEVLWPE